MNDDYSSLVNIYRRVCRNPRACFLASYKMAKGDKMSDERKEKWTPPKIDYIENKTNQMEQMFMQRTKREDREFFLRTVIRDAPIQQNLEVDEEYVDKMAGELWEFRPNVRTLEEVKSVVTQIISDVSNDR